MAVENNLNKGFSLIELVTGIVVFSITMVVVITLVINQTQQSIDPVLQTRAAELAKSLANEILSKAYDENAFLDGGILRCSEADAENSCTAIEDFGPDGEGANLEQRADYDDVDDYHNLFANTGGDIESAIGTTIASGTSALYRGFAVDVTVEYNNRFGDTGKLVTIKVTTSSGDELDFAFFRMNY